MKTLDDLDRVRLGSPVNKLHGDSQLVIEIFPIDHNERIEGNKPLASLIIAEETGRVTLQQPDGSLQNHADNGWFVGGAGKLNRQLTQTALHPNLVFTFLKQPHIFDADNRMTGQTV